MPKMLLLLLLPLALFSGLAQATYVVGLGTGAMSSNEQEFFETTKNIWNKNSVRMKSNSCSRCL